MKEFVYFSKELLDIPLNESIIVTNKSEDEFEDKQEFIVSNSDEYDAEIVADEIDFYIKNTKDSLSKQIKNIEKLYEVNAIKFDMAKDVSYSREVSNSVLLICNDEQYKLVQKIMPVDEFDLFKIEASLLEDVSGSIGELKAVVNDKDKKTTLEISQIIWFDAKDIALQRSGCFDPLKSSLEDVMETIRENISEFTYNKNIIFDENICQYHERRDEICARCVDECPTVAITKDNNVRHLEFSQVDCIDCGGCISVCPSGALDYLPSNRESISEMAKLLNGHIPLIVPARMDIEDLEISLKEDVLPFAIYGESFLHEATLLTLLQESGSQIVFYSDLISKGTTNVIDILNQIYQRKYKVDAILVASNKEELEEALAKVDFVENSRYSFNNHDVRKREIFAIRLKYIVGEDDLGTVKCGDYVHYGVVKVKEDNCTLCLSCVGACNLGAITADKENNSLLINHSICTTCGYCETTCPEKDCLSIEKDIIKLSPLWFTNNVLAQDDLFPCVECGKEFATKKAIDKIANMLAPLFKSDPIKERALYCCEDCKPKLMMKSYMKDKSNYDNSTLK